MKCYRVYIKNELVGTFFSLAQAMIFVDQYYSNKKFRIEIEKYEN